MRLSALLLMMLGGLALARSETVRFLRWNEAQPVIAGFAAPGEIPPELNDAKQWDGWIRQRDAEIRRTTDRRVEDSISMLILSGTSFTTLSRLWPAREAVNPAGDLTPAARARVSAFIEALDRIDSEPFRSILQFLSRRMVSQDELRAYLTGNLRRAILERDRDPSMIGNGALLTDSVIEETLRRLHMDGKMPATVRRIGVISPDLNLGNDPGSPSPFGSLEAILQLGLAKPGNVELVALDFNPWVLSQVRAAAKAGAQNRARISVQDLDVVAQTIDTPANQGFDLIVAINGLEQGGNFNQALAIANLARMMASRGILLVKGRSASLPPELELLSAGPGEGIVVYRRR